ncbi:MAG: recombination mediator RecR [Pseudomonadota bacterium]|nr:recombination mediator RecR [Pseudomonadota bacterium]
MTGPEIERLIQLLSRLPGLGPRSARRAALHLMKKKEEVLEPLTGALAEAARVISTCATCGNLDSRQPCSVCSDPNRDTGLLCVVEDVGDLWAVEKSAGYRGMYHVLGGTLSALAGVGPDDLAIPSLMQRLGQGHVRELILALNATVEGQTTAHYIADRAAHFSGLSVTRLAHGVPVGGELHWLDSGTLVAALRARISLSKEGIG